MVKNTRRGRSKRVTGLTRYAFPLKPGQTREDLYEEVIQDSLRRPEYYTP